MTWSVRGRGGRQLGHFTLAIVAVVVLLAMNGCKSKSLNGRDTSPPNETTIGRLDADTRSRVLTEVATLIRDHYADQEVGKSLADTILALLHQGQFDPVVDAGSLVTQIMAVIRTKVPDRHFDFSMRLEPENQPTQSRSGTRSEHGLKTTRMLKDNIAYLEFDGLPGDDASLSFVEQALAALPEVDALIIDIRNNIGGSGDMVVLLCSHLVEAGTLLYDYRDRSGASPGEMRARHYGRRFGPAVPVYILTGGATLSAAEALAYVLQDYERARIVGQRTPGMANPSRAFSIGDDFTITIPFLLFRYGESRTTFAGVGIVPDRLVPAESALDVALAEISASVPSRVY